MKGITQKELNESRPREPTLDVIRFCLECLYEDRSHTLGNVLTDGKTKLTYEELIGALLKAQDMAEEMRP